MIGQANQCLLQGLPPFWKLLPPLLNEGLPPWWPPLLNEGLPPLLSLFFQLPPWLPPLLKPPWLPPLLNEGLLPWQPPLAKGLPPWFPPWYPPSLCWGLLFLKSPWGLLFLKSPWGLLPKGLPPWVLPFWGFWKSGLTCFWGAAAASASFSSSSSSSRSSSRSSSSSSSSSSNSSSSRSSSSSPMSRGFIPKVWAGLGAALAFSRGDWAFCWGDWGFWRGEVTLIWTVALAAALGAAAAGVFLTISSSDSSSSSTDSSSSPMGSSPWSGSKKPVMWRTPLPLTMRETSSRREMKTLMESWGLSLERLAMRNSSLSFLMQRVADSLEVGASTTLVNESTSP